MNEGSSQAVASAGIEVESPVLSVIGVRTVFETRAGRLKAVDGVTFQIGQGETVAIVGESGSGKSVTALSILRLVPSPPGRITDGRVELAGTDLIGLDASEIEDVRGNRISMIFQEPLTALNPVMNVERQLSEVLERHKDLEPAAQRERILDMLRSVGISDPEARLKAYPHQLSGGMRQRVMIAMALLAEPELLIADEPTTALDVTIQAQILQLIRKMRELKRTAVLLITHDLGVVAEMADRVVVMYAGRIVESAPVRDLFHRPAHPYSLGLKRSTPDLAMQRGELKSIPGVVPTLADLATMVGCRFADRCEFATVECRESEPPLVTIGHLREVRCFHHEQVLEVAERERANR